MKEPTNQELLLRVVKLEERMNTHQAEYRTDLATYAAENRAALHQIAEDMAKRDVEMSKRDIEMSKRDAERDAEMSKRDIESAKRENRLVIVALGGIGVATAILGVLISLN